MRVFQDESGLSTSPHLWESVSRALDASRWFIVLASPDAARSEWVAREISHWKETHGHETILPVLTGGHWAWDDSTGDFSADSDAVPPRLRNTFSEEPRFLDLRWAATEEQLDLRNGRFRDAVADLAATIHGVDKDDLESEDVRHHKRALRLARGAAAALVVLLIASLVGGLLTLVSRNQAEDRRVDAVSRQLAAQSLSRSPRAIDEAALLGVAANEVRATPDARSALLSAIQRSPRLVTLYHPEPEDRPILDTSAVAWSPDMEQLATTGGLTADDDLDVVTVIDTEDRTSFRSPINTVSTQELLWPQGDELVALSPYGVEGIRIGDAEPRFATGEYRDEVMSPDKTRVVVFPKENVVELRALVTGDVLYRGSSSATAPPAFSAEGSLVALPGPDATVVVLRATDGSAVGAPLQTGRGDFGSLAVADDGVVYEADGERVTRWAPPYDQGQVLVGSEAEFRAVAVTPDGAVVGATGPAGTAVWEAPSGALRWRRAGSPAPPDVTFVDYGVAIGQDGGTVLDYGVGLTVSDAATGAVRTADPAFLNGIVSTSPDGRWTLGASADGVSALYDLRTGSIAGRVAATVRGANWSPDGRWLTTTGDDLLLWRLGREGAPEALVGGPQGPVDVAYSPDGTRLASVGDGDTVAVWTLDDVAPGGRVLYEEQDTRAVSSVDPETESVLIVADDELIVRSSDGEERRIDLPRTDGQLALPAPGGRFAIVQFFNGGLAVVDLEDGAVTRPGAVCGARSLDDVAVSGDGERIATVTHNGTVRRCALGPPIGDAEEFRIELARGLDSLVNSPALDETGETLVVPEFGRATVVDLDAQEVVDHVDLYTDDEAENIDVNPLGTGAIAISADGSTVAVGAVGGNRVLVEEIDSGENHRILGHPDGTMALALSPDGRVLAIVEPQTERATGFPAVRLRDLEHDVPLGDTVLFGELADPVGVQAAFALDGELLFVSAYTYAGPIGDRETNPTGITRTVAYTIDDAEWARRACELAGRRLSPEEWAQLLPGTDYVEHC